MIEQKSYRVADLLSAATLTERFYGLIHDLSGREKDQIYYNPGTSLKSFIIAHCVKRDIVSVDGQMLDIIRECEQFQSNKTILIAINQCLISTAAALVNQINTMPKDAHLELIERVVELHQIGQVIKASFDALLSTQAIEEARVDMSSYPALTYKQALYDIQDKIDEITDLVREKLQPEPEAA